MAAYDNKNMPLTSGCAGELIKKLFAGKGNIKRAEMIETLTKYHNENGGRVTPQQQRVSAVKKALKDLEAQGVAEKHPSSSGYWRIHEQETQQTR